MCQQILYVELNNLTIKVHFTWVDILLLHNYTNNYHKINLIPTMLLICNV